MIKPIKELRFVITGEEAEKIVADHIESLMIAEGYELRRSVKQDDNYWPDMVYVGQLVHETPELLK